MDFIQITRSICHTQTVLLLQILWLIIYICNSVYYLTFIYHIQKHQSEKRIFTNLHRNIKPKITNLLFLEKFTPYYTKNTTIQIFRKKCFKIMVLFSLHNIQLICSPNFPIISC